MNTRVLSGATAAIRPYVQPQRGRSSLLTGVAFVPMMLLGASLRPLSARIVERAGPIGRFRPREAVTHVHHNEWSTP
jgi:hypothetical protein